GPAHQLPVPARAVSAAATVRASMRALLALLLAAAALGAAAPAALADADPPSDVLLLQSVYYPYQPPVSDKLRRTLDKVVLDARQAGYPVKVALVESTVDLGA